MSERLEKGDVKTPSSILLDAGSTKNGTEEIMNLFDGLKVFDYPKPTSLIERLIQYGIIEDEEIVMDFFSGSATTAHATFNFNTKRGKHLSWILVQLPVDLDDSYEKSDSSGKGSLKRAIDVLDSIGRPHVLTELAKERINRVITKMKKDGANIDLGYRLFKVSSSNMRDIYYSPKALKKDILDYASANIKSERTGDDLLIQVLLELGIELSVPIHNTSIGGKEVFDVDNGYLIACFDENITDEVVTEIAKRKPAHVVFRDSSMANDSVAINFEQIFKAYSPNTKTRVL